MLPYTDLTDYLDAEVAIVLEVQWCGRTWYLSNRELTGAIHALPGFVDVPAVDDAISLSSADSGISVPLGFVLPLDVQARVEAGYDLHDLVAEVSIVWHRNGALLHSWAARQVVAQGDLGDPETGIPGQPAGFIAATLEDSPYRRRVPAVARSWEINEDTWPAARNADRNDRIPYVFGAPSVSGSADIGLLPDAVVIEDAAGIAQKCAFSMGPARATTCRIYDAAGVAAIATLTVLADGLGQVATIADVSALGAIDLTSTFKASWDYGPAATPFGTTATALRVAAYLLAVGGADVDLVEWVRVSEMVDVTVAGWVDDPDTEGWEVARDLLAGLPISTRRTQDGWAPVLIDPAIASQLIEGIVREGQAWRRISGWQVASEQRIAAVDVTSPQGSVQLGAGRSIDAPLPHAYVRHLPRQGQAQRGMGWSWSRTTDYRGASWAARIGAMGWQASAWQVPAPYGRLRPGDWATLIDAAGTSTSVLVQRRTLAEGVWDYTLVRPAA